MKAHYIIIGHGRVASHFQHYMSLLKLSFETWHRHDDLCLLPKKLQRATHVLILITDKAINDFIKQHLLDVPAQRIHFSGSLVSELAHGAHPLMTFNHDLYDFQIYHSIPFIIDDDAPNNLLPGFPNPQFRLSKTSKAKYHALCVMSGNFTCLLWEKFFSTLASEFKMDPAIAYPYLQQQIKNIQQDYKLALTGPLVRNDQPTIKANLAALDGDPFQEVYKSFVSCYQQINLGKTNLS